MKPKASILPSLIPSVAPAFYGGSGATIVESLSVNTEFMLQECAGDYDYDSDFAGDLICYQRDNDSGKNPGCIRRGYLD